MVKERVFDCESHVEMNVVKSNWALNLNVNITVHGQMVYDSVNIFCVTSNTGRKGNLLSVDK